MFSKKITERLKIQLPTFEDAKEHYELVMKNKDRLSIWFPWAPKYESIDDSNMWIEGSISGNEHNTNLEVLILYDDRIIGTGGFNDKSDFGNRRGEIGYWIDRYFEGKGIMTQVVSALIAIGFGEKNLNKIEIHARGSNARSRAIPEKLGFKLDGILRQHEMVDENLFEDLYVYSLLKAEWEN